MSDHQKLRSRLLRHLGHLYDTDRAARTADELVRRAERVHQHASPGAASGSRLFDERDVVLITYADQLRAPGEAPLRTLHRFLCRHLAGTVSGVHLLPFYPWTSDDGFSVVDYDAVDPQVGTWDDVVAVGRDFRLMVDAVFNHVSSQSPWFRQWCDGDERYADFFITQPPDRDLSAVTRPRPTPVLTPVETVRGVEHVWTTFSPDQVDLNYANPAVLLAVTDSLLGYLERGARIIRLDAVAFLWKEPGTSCIHLPQTHEIIRLWRTLVDAVAPGTLLITETNVPHAENVSYFGDGTDEAHLVYQFPLAPLVLSAFLLADASLLREWAAGLRAPSAQTTFFNFLGSHDGVGVRPAEGLLTPAEIDQLCELTRAHGGGVSLRQQPDGTLSPYELNTVYFDALTPVDSPEPLQVQVDRFMCAQSILLALAGVPAVYVQALLGSRNWHEGVHQTGRLRSINRQKLDEAALEQELATPGTLRHAVFHRMLERIRLRIREPAFHPNAAQRVLPGSRGVFAFERVAPDGRSGVVAVHSLSGIPQRYRVGRAEGLDVPGPLVDLCSGAHVDVVDAGIDVALPGYGVRWLRWAR